MKITKQGIDLELVAKLKELEKIAKLDCDECPCCGETKTSNDYYFDQHILHKGIDERCTSRQFVGRGQNKKLYETTVYRCFTCGAEWESEPYEVLREMR